MRFETINKKYDYAFAGATALAVACAKKLHDKGYNCLIFDCVGMLGHEFSYALCGSQPIFDENITNAETGVIFSQFKAHGAVNEYGKIHIPSITPILSFYLCDSGVDFYPYTVASNIEKTTEGWNLTLCSVGKRSKIDVQYIIDTTTNFSLGHFFGFSADIKECTLNAAVCPPVGYNGEGFTFDGHEIYRACFSNEYYAKFKFGKDISKARAMLVEYITSHPQAIIDWKIISIAEELDIKCESEFTQINDKFLRCPSSQYDNVIQAFDAGITLADNIANNTLPENKNICPKVSSPIIKEEKYNVIVAGLGTAGAVAAITAAKEGLRVLGLEQLNTLGGMGTVGAISSRYLGFKGGLYEEINKTAAKLRENGFVSERDEGSMTKALALDMTTNDCGVDVRRSATVIDVLYSPTDKKRITGLYWIEADGLHCAYSDYVIDSTADGLVCLMAGCEMIDGREFDNSRQLYSNVSCIYNTENATRGTRNQDEGNINQYNPLEFGSAIIQSCSSPLHLPNRYHEGNLRRLGPAFWLGIREGVKIVGEETVTLPDIHIKKTTDKPVFYEYSNLDNHRKDTFFEGRVFRDWVEICSLWDCRISFPIPLGALIPKGYYGLVVAGRCLSVDHEVSSAVRMKDAMQKSGEAVSQALALAIKGRVDIRNINYQELEKQLKICGVIGQTDCHLANYFGTNTSESHKNDIYNLYENPEKLQQMLNSNSGGAAIMAAAYKIDEYLPLLRNWLLQDGYISLNSALALCLGGYGNIAADVITKAILDKSGNQPRNSHTFNFPYAVSAISAAGKAGLTVAIDSLLLIACNPHYAEDIPVLNWFEGKTILLVDNRDVRYLYFTAAISALAEICKLHPEQKPRVSKALSQINLDEYETTISMIGHTDNIRLSSRHLIEKLIKLN